MTTIKALSAVVLGVAVCIAQTIHISGKVTDTGTTPIVGAVVKLERAGLSATTGSDGTFTLTDIVNISGQKKQSQPNYPSAIIHNGLLRVQVVEKSVVEIATYELSGKALSKIQQTIDAGVHLITLPRTGAGVYLYKIKSGLREFVIKGYTMGAVSQGRSVAVQGFSPQNIMAKKMTVDAAINDVIAVTKNGYLNYHVTVTNSDTNGIEIKMIVCEDTVTDADGNVYQAVRIGNQVWTVENWRSTKYNDGSAIPLVTDSAAWVALNTPGYCYYNNTTNADTIKKWGALYNWYVVDPENPKKLAPNGWHVPTDAEFISLVTFLISNGYNWDGTTGGNKIAKSVAAKTDWLISPTPGKIGCNLTTNNKSGFCGLPGGYRSYQGTPFRFINEFGGWWSTSLYDDSYPLFYYLSFDDYSFLKNAGFPSAGYSVRLETLSELSTFFA